jgi:hypothetical protein
MSEVPDWMAPLALPTLKQGKRVLAVEGDDDKDVYTAWLKKLSAPGTIVTDKLLVVEAGDKGKVLQGLAWYGSLTTPPPGELFGLVDRDEWDWATVKEKLAQVPRLLINPGRHCLESYFVEPTEIESALRAKDSTRYGPHIAPILAQLEGQRAAWVDHWSLWVTMCRVSRRMTEESFPGFFHEHLPLPDDTAIQEQLAVWANLVEPGAVFLEFERERGAARAKPSAEQFRGCIHAKRFYRSVVVQELLHPLGAHDARNWMLKLAKWMPAVPIDLRGFLQPLLL